jgi:hypothetical protein
MFAVSCSRNEIDHRFDGTLEQHRQYDDVLRRDPEEAGPDRHDIRRHLRDQHAPGIGCTLPDEAFAEQKMVAMGDAALLGAGVGIGGEELEARRAVRLHEVDHAVLRVDERRELGKEQRADGGEIASALQHVGEAGEVGL